MDIGDAVLYAVAIGVIVWLLGIVIWGFVYSDEYVYENILATVSDKYDESTTTMVVVSTGKTTSVIPSTTTDYYITTNYGNISVPYSEYVALKNNDTVVLTKNLNTSSLEYNCRIAS